MGFRRAWAALRYDEHREVNKKKVIVSQGVVDFGSGVGLRVVFNKSC